MLSPFQRLLTLSCTATLLLAACAPTLPNPNPNQPASPNNPATPGLSTLQAPSASELQTLQDSGLVAANTRFGLKLFKAIEGTQQGQNLFVSPLSVSIALAMTLNGTAGDTRSEMLQALELQGMDLSQVNAANLTLRKRLANPGPGVELLIANALWGKAGLTFNPNFLKSNQDFFAARVTALDFMQPASISLINQWASANTKGKIPQVISQISPETILILMNAIYFKGSWKDPFEKAQTEPKTFTKADGSTKEHPSMRRYGKYRYLRDTEQKFQAVALPYGANEDARMYVFLPDEDSNTHALLQSLTPEALNEWLPKMRRQDGAVVLPRFTFKGEQQLNAPLQALGLRKAFSEGQADFSDLLQDPASKAFISNVKQDSFVEVNEEGTEAAAVTTVTVGATSVQIPQEPFNMEINRPFIHLIRDEKTGAILFMGVTADPQ
jgi:serine protease inhibitor